MNILRGSRRYVSIRCTLLLLIAFICSFTFITLLEIILKRSSSPDSKYYSSLGQLRGAALDVLNFNENDGMQLRELHHHPFDNFCKFPVPNIYAPDIMTPRLAQRLRVLQCPFIDKDLATMDSEGFMYVHPHYVNYPKYYANVSCKVHIIEGGLRANNKTKNDFYEVSRYEAPTNQRFWVNADAFFIKCQNDSVFAPPENKTLFHKTFAGIRDRKYERNQLLTVSDMPSFTKYGAKKLTKANETTNRYSIDILGFDSTSRTMFMRHLPRTVEMMNRLGYHFFYGYNKVSDNSMVNLGPILIGDAEQAMRHNKTDASGDINVNWILPQSDRIDPSDLKFLWNEMKEKYGCETMLNEDISKKGLGLFTYPRSEFMPGFREAPADHYYRAYYLSIYDKWKYSQCNDGGQIQNDFIALWRRFAHQFKDICHFGFTFVTTLTHEKPFTLEIVDENLANHLAQLETNGALDKTLSIIMGDHGNRLGSIQWTYTGRIEERMPLMAIKLPKGFKEKYPVEYQNFLENKYKLTSNFDIHKMLTDIVDMRFGEDRSVKPADTGRGISLFDKISSQRTCQEATIPENFCMCLVDVSNITYPMPHIEKVEESVQLTSSMNALRTWVQEKELDNCIVLSSLEPTSDSIPSLSINHYSRHGLRFKFNLTVNEMIRQRPPKNDFLYHEFTVNGMFEDDNTFEILVRTQLYVSLGENEIVYEPFVQKTSAAECTFFSLFEICRCLGFN